MTSPIVLDNIESGETVHQVRYSYLILSPNTMFGGLTTAAAMHHH